MKDQFLKLAGAKNEKEFYKLFPTEEAFMAKYGKKIKKLQFGEALSKIAGSNAFAAGAQSIGSVVEGFQQRKADKEKLAIANQSKGLSEVSLQAAMTKPEPVEKRRLRPEDNVNTGEAFFPVFGVGTTLAKNGTEIANTFAPNTIYTDLEQAFDGFKLPKINTNPEFMKQATGKNAKAGDVSDIFEFVDKGGGDALSQMTSGIFNPKGYGTSGSGKIGGGIGEAAGTLIGGPVAGKIGKFFGEKIGDGLDRTAEKTEAANKATMANVKKMELMNNAKSLQQQNYSYMKRGGMVNPQVATELEGIPLTRLFAPDPYMDTLRTGGNFRQNNVGMDGDLRTHWGGGIETISRNPYRDGSGKIEILTGNSHEKKDKYGRTGVGISVGDTGNSPFQDYAEYGSKLATGKADVEAEKGEPVTEKMEPDGSISAVVHGNLLLSKANAELIGMPEYANTKIKNATAKIGDKEKKINKRIESSVTKLNELNPNNSYDLLSFNTEKFNIEAGNKALITTADQTNRLASIQDAINRTADENGFNADALAKGKVKQAKMGAKLSIAKDGFTMGEQKKAKEYYEAGKKSGDMSQFQKYASEIAPDLVKSSIDKYGMPAAGSFIDKRRGKRTDEVYTGITDATRLIPEEPGMPSDFNVDTSGMKKAGTMQDMVDYFKGQVPAMKRPFDETKSDKFDWTTIANQILPYIRPTNAEELDPRQLAGEMYALSTNQVEPVNAQLFRPQLNTPYDISLQDQLNANQSDYRAAQRMMGYNPAAQAMLNAQKYEANQKVLGEQFRMNQGMRDKVFGENRQLIDQANLQNLGILDQQYGRQQQALSNTKATTQAALNSISAKYLQNQNENRTLQTYENMYNYRFDPRFRAMNMNPLTQFNTEMQGPSSPEMQELFREYEKKNPEKFKKGSDYRKNGGLVRAIKDTSLLNLKKQ